MSAVRPWPDMPIHTRSQQTHKHPQETSSMTVYAAPRAARSTAEDIELALDAAHAASDAWGRTSAAERANVLLKIADRIEANLELLAYAETVDNGKAIRETLNADIPLTVDHFRYFAGCVRAQEGALSHIDETTVAYHIQEPDRKSVV